MSLPFFPPPAFAQAASVPAIRCLTPDGGRQPSFFPDGKRIVYVHETSEGQEHLMILDLATGKATRVGKIDGADHPTVSPDGKWIAYAAGPIFARQIWVVEVATGKARQLTTGFAGRGSPNWADGGRKILFSLSKEKKQSWTKLDPFKSPPAAEELKPLGPGRVTVSASGKLFALVTTDERGSNHLRILRPNGSTVAEMSFASGSASSTPVRGCYDPAFSADDRYVAYVRSNIQPDSDIYIHDLKTGRERPLTADRKDNQSPAFSPDGKSIAFVAAKDGRAHKVFLVRVNP